MKKYHEQEIETTFKELLTYIDLMENKDLIAIAKSILIDNKESFCNRSAMPDYYRDGIYEEGSHHFFKGGLLYHSLGVTKLSLEIAKLYNSKVIDSDLIIFGASLHDIGKIETMREWIDNEELKCPKTINSNLLEHTYFGVNIVKEYLDKSNLGNIVKNQMLHIIATHMSQDIGTFTDNCMIESIIVAQADDLDSKIEPIEYNLSKLYEGEKEYYDKNFKRKIYLSDKLRDKGEKSKCN